MIYLSLVIAFAQVGLFSVGGGYAALPLIKQQIVDINGWITLEQFTDMITIAEMTPGPVAINTATFAGMRIAGLGGAVAASFGTVLPALFICSALAYIYYKYKEVDVLKSVLGTLRPASVALIFGAGLSIFRMVAWQDDEWNVAGIAIFAVAYAVLRIWKPGAIKTMALCGAAGAVVGMMM